MKSILTISLVFSALVAIIVLSLYFSVNGITVNISEYKGDGRITQSGAGFLAKGYRIDFDSLRLIDNKYSGIYKLNGMPNLKKKCSIYIKINENYKTNFDISKYAGDINLIATNANGKVIFNSSSNLSDWTLTSIDHDNIYLYSLSKELYSGLDFTVFDQQPIYIEIRYKPLNKAMLNRTIAINLVIEAGGRI